MTFTTREIDVTFALTQGQFSGGNAVTLSGYRTSAVIQKQGAPGMGQADIRIFGVPDSISSKVATYGAPRGLASPAQVQIAAGNPVTGKVIVFNGDVMEAWVDYSQVPEVSLVVVAYTGAFQAINSGKTISVQGTADAATLLANLAAAMNLQFENNGVSVQLTNPYFTGSPWKQANDVARAANVNMVVEEGTLAIWPKNGSRSGGAIVISPQTGMIGYPTFMLKGVQVRCLPISGLRFGSLIQVQSSLPQASGTWVVWNMLLELEAEMPDGQWAMTIQAFAQDSTGNG